MVSPDQAWKEIGRSRGSLGELEAPLREGVYAIFLRSETDFPLPPGNGGLLYVGRSSNLAQREFDTHFAEGRTGFSTLRRSIGALLRDELSLEAIPRGRGASKSNYEHYRFTDDGEKRLSGWMEGNLELGVAAASQSRTLEHELIAQYEPVLCLRGWPNPSSTLISQMRKACMEEAQKTRR